MDEGEVSKDPVGNSSIIVVHPRRLIVAFGVPWFAVSNTFIVLGMKGWIYDTAYKYGLCSVYKARATLTLQVGFLRMS
jgi:hypothetical protein